MAQASARGQRHLRRGPRVARWAPPLCVIYNDNDHKNNTNDINDDTTTNNNDTNYY